MIISGSSECSGALLMVFNLQPLLLLNYLIRQFGVLFFNPRTSDWPLAYLEAIGPLSL